MDNQIVVHNGFTLSYNETCEQPNWVKYTVTKRDLVGSAKRKNYFKKDTLVKTESASSSDYTNTGYDRGHLKPAANEKDSQVQMNETFYMSNISPQAKYFNKINKNIVVKVYEDTEENINLSELISKSLKKLGNKS